MKEQEYLEQRLDDQLNWYDRKSQSNQSSYKGLKMIEFVTAAIIPLCATILADWAYFSWLVGGLGVIIAVVSASQSHYKFQENWIQYRTTAEQLKHEKYLFMAGVEPYRSEDAFQTLVLRVEGLISKENSSWAQTAKQEPNKDKTA